MRNYKERQIRRIFLEKPIPANTTTGDALREFFYHTVRPPCKSDRIVFRPLSSVKVEVPNPTGSKIYNRRPPFALLAKFRRGVSVRSVPTSHLGQECDFLVQARGFDLL